MDELNIEVTTEIATDVVTEIAPSPEPEPVAEVVAEPAPETPASNVVEDPKAAETEPPPEPREVEMRRLSCALTEEDLMSLRKDSADLAVEICDNNEQLKRFTDETKASVKAKENKRRAITEKLDARSEHRNVECVWVKNFGNGRKELLRSDTGDVVEWKPLSREDRQQNIPIAPTAPATEPVVDVAPDEAPVPTEAPEMPVEPLPENTVFDHLEVPPQADVAEVEADQAEDAPASDEQAPSTKPASASKSSKKNRKGKRR